MNQLIIQDKNKPVSIEEQVIYLYALDKGMLDNMSINQVRDFKRDILSFMLKQYPQFCTNLRNTRELDDELKAQLQEGFKKYLNEIMK
jgi:F0F1-type ATP synthase alpha subunit